jgi:branched-chain amino acid transport system permease protein
MAGGLYAGFVRFLGPGLAGVEHSFDMTMYMLVGGLGTLLGPLLGALMVPWLTQYLQFLQEYRFLVFGPILVLLVIFVPHGIVGSYVGWRARRDAALAGPAPAADIPQAVKPQPEGSHA